MNSELKQAAQQGVDAELAEMEAENKPAGEPVAWIDLRDGDIVQLGDRLLSGGKTWRTVDLESNLIGRAYRAKQWWPMQRAYTHHALGVPDAAIDSAIYNQCPDFDDWHEGPSIDDIRAIVRTAIQQAEAQQPATPEPVAWFEYSERHKSWFLAYTRNPHVPTRPLVFGDTHPAPSAPGDVARDAERYRFIRDADVSDDLIPDIALYAMESLDEYIDAAMLAAK